MRRINVETITQNIKEMCIEANHFLSPDMKKVFDEAAASEESPLGRQILGQLEENLCIAGEEMIPICQDTGMAVVFIKVLVFFFLLLFYVLIAILSLYDHYTRC